MFIAHRITRTSKGGHKHAEKVSAERDALKANLEYHWPAITLWEEDEEYSCSNPFMIYGDEIYFSITEIEEVR